MTPAARLSAAITVLDHILDGEPAERALTNWARNSRFAGSGDRAALRDLVFQALRCRRSYAAFGGGLTGRGLILGGLRAEGIDPGDFFTGIGHAPAAPANEPGRNPEGLEVLDCPDWLALSLQASLGVEFTPVMQALRHRAPVYLRVNTGKTTREAVQANLAQEGIICKLSHLAKNALEVTGNTRKIQNSATYANGLIELQDAASQAVVELLPLRDGMRVLDYCAGGGGKTLAMASMAQLDLYAHDANPGRMGELTTRSNRAGIQVSITDIPEKSAPYDLILTDVPCSGSGSWRRDPQGKWALDPVRLQILIETQTAILDRVAPMVAVGGILAYVTCSLLNEENSNQITDFLARSAGWHEVRHQQFTPLNGGDGFFISLLSRLA